MQNVVGGFQSGETLPGPEEYNSSMESRLKRGMCNLDVGPKNPKTNRAFGARFADLLLELSLI